MCAVFPLSTRFDPSLVTTRQTLSLKAGRCPLQFWGSFDHAFSFFLPPIMPPISLYCDTSSENEFKFLQYQRVLALLHFVIATHTTCTDRVIHISSSPCIYSTSFILRTLADIATLIKEKNKLEKIQVSALLIILDIYI